MTFHNQCLDKTTDQCFSCIGIEDQDTVINSVNSHQTVVKQTSHNLQNLDINNSGPTPNLITSVSSAKNAANLDKQSDHNTINTQNEIQTSSKMKELRTLELKLKKKEEQLKIKEAMLNEDMKEKTKIMDRLHKAEIRNIELENTIKTLQTRIEQIPINSVVNNSNPTNSQSKIKEEEDELIIGMRKRVTKFVLNKIDKELNKLESNSDHSEHNTETSSNPQYNYERQNYSDNYWNYNNGYSGQYRDTQPYYNYHHNWQQGHNEDSSSYQNTEITHNICTDNLIEIQPTNVHSSTINSKPVNTQHTTYCDKNKLPKFNCNLEKVNRNSQNSEKHTNQSQTQNSEHYFSTIEQPLYFHPTPQQTHFLQLASLNPSRYKEPNL
ncbi:GATA zinc finger domain-containing protein 14-like [Mytilus edulis]|uniref:GATA zinc finger domain-containing protein 14-like n=1 Tax=Mytilus edulis TaxID=6550 RepID=UPI0039EFCFED